MSEKMNVFFLKAIAVSMLCMVCFGCGNGLVKVSGEVTCNGTPIKEGEIRFLPTSGEGPSAAAVITAGRYSVEVSPGEKKVKIFANKVIGTENIGKIIKIKEQYLPGKFNDKTVLTCEIAPDGCCHNKM